MGITLILVSSYRIVFAGLAKDQLLGPGISLASGLTTMLLVIYTGPLRQIRQSVNDLGIASASFIAYIHRILEISHTFSFFYLKQQITVDNVAGLNKLIDEAMSSTIGRLSQQKELSTTDGPGESD